jgi:hypothetical protein
LSASGTLSVTDNFEIKKSVNVSGTGTLSAVATNVSQTAIANFNSVGTLNSATGSSGSGTAVFNSSAILAVTTSFNIDSIADVSSIGNLGISSSGITVSQPGNIIGSGILSASGQPDIISTAVVFGNGLLTSDIDLVDQSSLVLLTSSGMLTVEAGPNYISTAGLSSTGSLIVISRPINVEYADLTSIGILTATGIGLQTFGEYVGAIDSRQYNGSIIQNSYTGEIVSNGFYDTAMPTEFSLRLYPSKRLNQ